MPSRSVTGCDMRPLPFLLKYLNCPNLSSWGIAFLMLFINVRIRCVQQIYSCMFLRFSLSCFSLLTSAGLVFGD
jgi:hypothetical protein